MNEALFARVAQGIATVGWEVIGVFGDDPDECFAYTVGLAGLGFPELVVTGMTGAQAWMILNRVAEHITDAGGPPAVGASFDVGWSVLFRLRGPVDPRDAGAFVALDLFPDVRVLQVLWPDTAGVFPDGVGFAQRFTQRLVREAT